jgi:hypothetical protein
MIHFIISVVQKSDHVKSKILNMRLYFKFHFQITFEIMIYHFIYQKYI